MTHRKIRKTKSISKRGVVRRLVGLPVRNISARVILGIPRKITARKIFGLPPQRITARRILLKRRRWRSVSTKPKKVSKKPFVKKAKIDKRKVEWAKKKQEWDSFFKTYGVLKPKFVRAPRPLVTKKLQPMTVSSKMKTKTIQPFKLMKKYKIRHKRTPYYRQLKEEYPYRITTGFKKVKGVSLGGYPNPLGYDLIFELKLSSMGNAGVRDARGRITKFKVKVISIALNTVKKELEKYAEKIIGNPTMVAITDSGYVPRDTGDLRKTMIDSIKDSHCVKQGNESPAKIRMKIRLGADLEYAGVVNRMPEEWIQHPHKGTKKIQYSKRGGGMLNDPKAQKGFYHKILMLLRTKSRELLRAMFHTLRDTMGRTRPAKFSIREEKIIESTLHYYIKRKGGKRVYYEPKEPIRERFREKYRRRMWEQAVEQRGGYQVRLPYNLVRSYFEIKGLKGLKG